MNLECIGKIDIDPILATLETVDWDSEPWRRHMPFSPHRDTDTVTLRGPESVRPRAVLESLEIVDRPLMKDAAVSSVVWRIASMTHRAPARALLCSLRPHGKVMPHVDEGRYATLTDRYHVVLKSNEDAWLEVDGEKPPMLPGEVWFVDKHKPHSAGNDGNSARIHLIVDVWRAA
jgi:aspartyl/asparaginyl beta-hydroxylase